MEPTRRDDIATSANEVHTRQTHCPRLGGQVPFSYCLAPGQAEPCFRILDCWWQTFDVVSYLQQRLAPQHFEKLLAEQPPPNRLNSILRILEDLTEKKGTDP
jgi:hypothetical protein